MKTLASIVTLAALGSPQFLAAETQEKGLRREVWTNVDGAGLWHLRNSPKFYQRPQIDEVISGSSAPDDFGDRYGQRLRGYIVPKVSGAYTFWIASDDNSELCLSSDENKFNKKRIAGISGLGWGYRIDFVEKGEWNRFPTQKSAEITLEAGKKYFIEALHKENRGSDHLAIAWTRPGKTKPQLIPSKFLRPYRGDELDLDGDDLPDEWERLNQMSSTDSGEVDVNQGPLGDPDGDGWLNWEECANDSNPHASEILAGCLQQEIWYGVRGHSVLSLYNNNQFHLLPDRRGLVQGCSAIEFPGDNQYGMRLRGYITPKVSGDYHLWICGDNNCEVLISSSDSRFNLERAAWIVSDGEKEGYTKPGEWEKFETQKSRLFSLVKGKRYYIEVLLKEGSVDGHVALNWTTPGSDERVAIPNEVLSSYSPTAEDPDDDGLPTSWELEHGLNPNSRVGKDGPTADPDGDRLPNWFEYDREMNPVSFNDLSGGFAEEIWRGIEGNAVSDLVHSAEFLNAPSSTLLRVGNFDVAARGNSYGMRLRATIEAPVSGDYTFWISSDNESELWLSENQQKFYKNKIAWLDGPGGGSPRFSKRYQWDRYPSQRSKKVSLLAGERYFIEALLKEGNGGDHVEVAWQVPDGEREVIPESVLVSHLRDVNDQDDDYLPDDWEASHGLSPLNNGFINRGFEGERGDFDQDGLSNWTEFRLGTNPASADSDGDGVADGVELNDYGSDPLVVDIAPPTLYSEVDLKDRLNSVGDWADEFGSILSSERRGEVSYSFSLDKAGVYFVELKAEVFSEERHTMPLRFLVNGEAFGAGEITGAQGVVESVSVRLPWLPAGEHTITVDSENVWKEARLRIYSLKILAPGGLDADEDGVADWLEGFLVTRNSASIPTLTSQVSPLCLEGISTWVGNTTIQNHNTTVEVLEGINQGWFANLPLKRNGLTPVEINFEGGLVSQSESLEWITTNILSQKSGMILRRGDALKLVAQPESAIGSGSQSKIYVDDELVYEGPSGDHVIHRFREAGIFQVKAVLSDSRESVIQVEVFRANFGAPLHVRAGQSRDWPLKKIPLALEIDSDQVLRAEEFFKENGTRALKVGFPDFDQKSANVLARLPGGGAVVSRGTVNSFIFAESSLSGDHEVLEILEDGAQLIEVGYVLDGPIPSDLSIYLSMWVPDAVFADGESFLILTAADFDENGLAKVRIIKAGQETENAVCHTVQIYEGKKKVSE